METKLSRLKAMMDRGEWREAISLAVRFGDLGKERDAIKRAQMAYTNPTFCKQIAREPESMIRDGREALCRRYGAPSSASSISSGM